MLFIYYYQSQIVKRCEYAGSCPQSYFCFVVFNHHPLVISLAHGKSTMQYCNLTGKSRFKSGKVVMEILQSLNEKEGKTVILVTHETYTAEHAERIIKMLDGKIENDSKVASRRKASMDFSK